MLLSDFLKKNKMSRMEFSKKLKISPTHMSDVCNGKKIPSLKLSKKIIEMTRGKVSIDDLLIKEKLSE